MNSWRDEVKDAIRSSITNRLNLSLEEVDADEVCGLADDVFEALGITEDEQDAEGGYFMHFAGKRSAPTYVMAEGSLSQMERPEKARLVRDMFMDMFRAEDGELNKALSTDDCCEIFQGILKGGSDITYKSLCTLIANYGGGEGDFTITLSKTEIWCNICHNSNGILNQNCKICLHGSGPKMYLKRG